MKALAIALSFATLGNYVFAQANDPSILKNPQGYQLRPGDQVRVTVQDEVECTVEDHLNAEGTITLTYINEVPIAKMTAKQAENFIATEYFRQQFFVNPRVSVKVTKYLPREVFLSGNIARPGTFALPPTAEAMTIVAVITRAGGFADLANKKKVTVTRAIHDEAGKIVDRQTHIVNVEEMLEGTGKGKEAKPFWIYPGDTIWIPERFI